MKTLALGFLILFTQAVAAQDSASVITRSGKWMECREAADQVKIEVTSTKAGEIKYTYSLSGECDLNAVVKSTVNSYVTFYKIASIPKCKNETVKENSEALLKLRELSGLTSVGFSSLIEGIFKDSNETLQALAECNLFTKEAKPVEAVKTIKN